MKTFFTIIAIVVLLIVGFVAYVFLTLDPEELGQRVLGMVNDKTGITLTAESFEVKPLKGLRLENGNLEGDLEAGSVTGSLDRMAFDYELLPILRGEIVVHQILVEGPTLEVVSRPAEAPPATAEPTPEVAESVEATPAEETAPEDVPERGFLTAVSISEIRVVDGNLKVTSEGSDSKGLAVQGFDYQLGDLMLDATAVPALLGLSAKGGIRIDQVQLNDLVIQGGRGDLALDHGRYQSIADFRQGFDDRGILPIVLERPAQLVDRVTERLVSDNTVRPHRFEQLFPAHGLPAVLDQAQEQLRHAGF